MKYPYFIVQRLTGKLPCPPEYRHTSIERQFKSGRIGGSNLKETICHTAEETQRAVLEARRNSAEVRVYVVLRPNNPRNAVYNCHGRVWTIAGYPHHIQMNQIDEELKWPKSSSTETGEQSTS